MKTTLPAGALLAATLSAGCWAQSTPELLWTDSAARGANPAQLNAMALGGRSLQGDIDALHSRLSALTPGQSITLALPLPEGGVADFELQLSPVVAPELAAKYPMIRTFSGHQTGQPQHRGRFDLTPQGFHGMFSYQNRTVMIDPRERGNDRGYLSYYRDQALPLEQATIDKVRSVEQFVGQQAKAAKAAPASLRTYRLAIAAAAEYTQFHGGTRTQALAALVTLVNRINEIFEQELSVRLELVADNDQVIFLNPATDPFDNDDGDADANPAVLNGALGIGGYDIGHVVGTGAGGLASVGVVCNNLHKAEGVSGSGRPTGDTFYIDLVAHELGHQFGAHHTFNGTVESCGGGNRSAGSAYEPGSGSTIMAYAGICGEQDLQSKSDAYFHAHSRDQVREHLTVGTGSQCGTASATGNEIPTADAGQNYTVPASTPFVLTGSGSDTDGDVLTYGWEQLDLGTASVSRAGMVDNGNRPLFRSLTPTAEPKRYFPQLASVLGQPLDIGETYATTDRALNFRLTVRDNRGGVAFDDMQVTVVDTGEAFAVETPSANWQTGSPADVNWQTAGSDQAPISCGEVTISLSTDGGQNFSPLLTTANDGQASLTVPGTPSTSARLQVACSNSVFYAVTPANFTITQGSVLTDPEITGQVDISILEDGSRAIALADVQIADPDNRLLGSLTLTLGNGANYSVNGQTLSPAADFAGTLSVPLTVSDSQGLTLNHTLTVTVTGVNDAPTAVNDSITVQQDSGQILVSVLQNDQDVDIGDTLSLTAVDYQGNSQVALSGNQVAYTPASGFNGVETIGYTLVDASGATASGSLSVTVQATATPTPTPSTSGGSSGGSLSLGVLVMGLWVALRRRLPGHRR